MCAQPDYSQARRGAGLHLLVRESFQGVLPLAYGSLYHCSVLVIEGVQIGAPICMLTGKRHARATVVSSQPYSQYAPSSCSHSCEPQVKDHRSSFSQKPKTLLLFCVPVRTVAFNHGARPRYLDQEGRMCAVMYHTVSTGHADTWRGAGVKDLVKGS